MVIGTNSQGPIRKAAIKKNAQKREFQPSFVSFP
jgi:hypothetical protein